MSTKMTVTFDIDKNTYLKGWDGSEELAIITKKDIDELIADNARLTAELAELRERTRWIPVSERLPMEGDNVLVHVLIPSYLTEAEPEGDIDTSRHNGERFVCFLGEYVTHWMPLPLPPEEE